MIFLKKLYHFLKAYIINNLNNAVNQFFNNADELFNKEMKKEDENQMKENKERCDFISSVIIPKTNQIVLDKEKTILDLIDLGKYRCLEIINDEIKIIDERLKESNKDVEKAARLLEQKIKNKIDEINKDQEKEINLIVKEKEDLLKDKINEYYKQKTLSKTNINTNKGLTMKMIISLFTSTISGIAIRSGLIIIGETIIAGAGAGAAAGAGAEGASILSTTFSSSLLGPAGILIGLGVGVAISLTTFFIHWFSK